LRYASAIPAKTQTLADLRAVGLAPRIDILTHALPHEETALRIEAAVIDALELATSRTKVGCAPLSDLIAT
jgi:hypothetical protein